MRYGIDTYSPPSVSFARSLGASFAVCYSSRLTRDDAEALAAGDIDIVLVFESSGESYRGGAAAGEYEATRAVQQATDAGMVGGYPIVFAPYDPATPAGNIDSNLGLLLPYFDGVRSVLPLSRIWAYGDYATVQYLFDQGKISGAMQAAAASGGRWDPRAQLRQTQYFQSFDRDEGVVEFFGQWRPGVPFHSRKPTSPVAYLLPKERVAYDTLRKALKHPVLNNRKLPGLRAKVARYRAEVYRAAVHGVLPSGKATKKGWHVYHRLERYHVLRRLVPPTA